MAITAPTLDGNTILATQLVEFDRETDPSKRSEIAAQVAATIHALQPAERQKLELDPSQQQLLQKVAATDTFQQRAKQLLPIDQGFAQFLTRKEAPKQGDVASPEGLKAREQKLTKKQRQAVSTIEKQVSALRSLGKGEDRERALTHVSGLVGKLPRGSQRRAEYDKLLTALRRAGADVDMESEGMARPDVNEALSFLEGKASSLPQATKAALQGYFQGDGTPEQRAVLDQLFAENPAAKARYDKLLADKNTKLDAMSGKADASGLGKLARMVREGKQPSETEVKEALGVGKDEATGLNWEIVEKLAAKNKELGNVAGDCLRGEVGYHLRASSISSEIMTLLHSNMPIEMVLLMCMMLMGELAEEKIKQKGRELAFATELERVAGNDPTFKPAELGLRVKPSQQIYNELQNLTQQMTQMQQALAAVMRMVQDMALSIIRNIR